MESLQHTSLFSLQTLILFGSVILIAIFLGIAFAVRLIRIVMPMPFTGMPIGGNQQPVRDNSITLLLLMLTLFSFFLMFYLKNLSYPSGAQAPPPQGNIQENQVNEQFINVISPSKEQYQSPNHKPFRSIEETHKPPPQRYNRSPKRKISQPITPSQKRPSTPISPLASEEGVKYGVQIMALSTFKAAETKAPILAGTHQSVILPEDGLFKIIVGVLDSEEAAQLFARRNNWNPKYVKKYVLPEKETNN